MKLSIYLLPFLCIGAAFGGEPKPGSPQWKAESFLETFIDGKTDLAIDYLVEGSGMGDLQPQQISVMKTQAKASFAVMGNLSPTNRFARRNTQNH